MALYGIQVGEYSDYRVVGYCTSEESAKKRCSVLNRNMDDTFDEYTYFELENLDCNDPVDVWFRAKALFSAGSGLKKGEYQIRMSDLIPVIGYKPIEIAKTGKYDHYYVTAYIKENDHELARKVLQDIFYKFLAEQEGL